MARVLTTAEFQLYPIFSVELPTEKTQNAYRECLKDIGLEEEAEEKYTSGLIIRSTRWKKSVASRAGRHILFASDEPTLLRAANALVKPIKNPLPTSKAFETLKPVLRPEQCCLMLLNLSEFLKRTMFFINLVAGNAPPEVKERLDKAGQRVNRHHHRRHRIAAGGELLFHLHRRRRYQG